MNDQQRLFVAEYLVDLNGAQAAIRAGYSEKGARVRAHQLLATPEIREAVEKAQAKIAAKLEIDALWVLNEAVELFNLAKNQAQTNPSASAIAAAKGVLDTIGKHVDIQAFRDRIEHTGDVQMIHTIELVALEGPDQDPA